MNHNTHRPQDFYFVGGTVNPQLPSYVERRADEELLAHLRQNHYCYVLASRQMGKSSLMARTEWHLSRDESCATAIVDTTTIGGKSAPEERWYYGITHRITQELEIDIRLSQWWRSKEGMPAVQKFSDFIREVILERIDTRIVIFLDEIDSLVRLETAGDFFAAIRACHNARAHDINYERLTFVLFGVVSPSELINDPELTPFNVGYRVELTDFSYDEARALAGPLANDDATRQSRLRRILYWTGGQPFLTQAACRTVAEASDVGNVEVDQVVRDVFLTPEARDQQLNLKSVSMRIDGRDKMLRQRLLTTYRQVLRGRKIKNSPLSEVQIELKLAGLVVADEQGYLRVKNEIYRRVFDVDWVGARLPINWTRRALAAVVTLLVALSGFVVYYLLVIQPQEQATRTAIGQLEATSDEAFARERYAFLKGRIPDLERRRLYQDFFERLAATYDGNARRELKRNVDESLLWATLAAHKTNRPLTPDFQEVLEERGYALLDVTLRGHREGVNSVYFIGDHQLVSASKDGSIALWELQDGFRRWTSAGNDQIDVISMSERDEGAIVAAVHDRAVDSESQRFSVWDLRGDHFERRFFRDIDMRFKWVEVSPTDDTLLIVGDNLARFGLQKRDLKYLEASDGARIWHAAFSSDGRQYATARADDSSVDLWDRATEKRIARFNVLAPARRVALGKRDGSTVVVAANSARSSQLWQVREGNAQRVWTRRHEGFVVSVDYCTARDLVLVAIADAGQGGVAEVWSREPAARPVQRFTLAGVRLRAAQFDGACRRIATGWNDGTVRVWRRPTAGEPGRGDTGWRVAQRRLGLTIDDDRKVVDLAIMGRYAKETTLREALDTLPAPPDDAQK